ncbi:pentatricopeptide repeat-containing protein At3g14730 [Rutidosis leptorrhynchoides]|uniref:pentatricopeptide repeat-containing protein At3g14730 n=1 Tax=Rutidosis leptorrhynchoides TaxID=125765 RepID=UPI003A99A697
MYKTILKTQIPNCFRLFSSLPNHNTCIASLKLCANQSDLQQGQKLHSYMLINGFLTSPLSVTSLINMYSKCNLISSAYLVFTSSSSTCELNVFNYNAIIAGFIHNDMSKPALHVYEKMRLAGVLMDKFTFPCVVKAYSGNGDVVGMKIAHGLVFKFGVDCDLFVGSTIAHGYLKFGLMVDAQKVFDEMSDSDVVLWNAMINGYAQIGELGNALECLQRLRAEGHVPSRFTVTGILSVLTSKGDAYNGKAVHGLVMKMGYFSGTAVCNALIDMYGKCKSFDEALKIFDVMAIKDIYSWNSIISVHQQSGDHDEALKLFERMLRDGVFCPDLVTVTTVLPVCSHLAALRHGKQIHGYIITKGLGKDNDDTKINNAVMDMYGKCGSMREAQLVFDLMSIKDSASWNIIIMNYAMHGLGNKALDVFNKMCEANMVPDEVTFVGVLSACSHTGLVKQGQEFLSQMKSKYNVEPTVEHYTCVIDMLGRAGLLDQAYGLLSEMPIESNSVVWRAFLAACRMHGDAKLAEVAAGKVIDLEPEHCGSYVLMSNVYGTMGRFEKVSDVRHNMRQQDVKKTPGCSWIEFGDGVHVFGTGDRIHPDVGLIYRKLGSLYMSMGLCQMT